MLNTNEILEKILLSGIKEQERSRRWNIFFKIISIIILFFFFSVIFLSSNISNIFSSGSKDILHTAIIDINGPILESEVSNAKNISISLYDAFSNDNVKGIILRINSPGGSPVQSSMIFNNIKNLKLEYPNKKIYSVIEDIGASGAYLIASATDYIYSDPSSIVGSIGVQLSSFGFVNLIEKIGIERRLYTSGSKKGILDPFTLENEDNKDIIENNLKNIHNEFINFVKQGRGDRLINNPEIFDGRFWIGREALSLGLIDGFADYRDVSIHIINAPIIVNYTKVPDIWEHFNKNIEKLNKNTMSIFLSQLSI